MTSRICDRSPCEGFAKLLPALDVTMVGESNEDQVIVAVVTKASAEAPVAVTIRLHYCPFCGMRLEEDIVEAVARSRRT